MKKNIEFFWRKGLPFPLSNRKDEGKRGRNRGETECILRYTDIQKVEFKRVKESKKIDGKQGIDITTKSRNFLYRFERRINSNILP